MSSNCCIPTLSERAVDGETAPEGLSSLKNLLGSNLAPKECNTFQPGNEAFQAGFLPSSRERGLQEGWRGQGCGVEQEGWL